MGKYQKDFVGWARVAEKIEKRERPGLAKPGAIYWCNFGVGIATEVLGKGSEYSRPCLVLSYLTDDLILVTPLTSKFKTGSNYEEVVINGKKEFLVLTQTEPVSILRITKFIDEMMPSAFDSLKGRYLRFVRYHLYKKVNFG